VGHPRCSHPHDRLPSKLPSLYKRTFIDDPALHMG
jgi:hypothetical protein